MKNSLKSTFIIFMMLVAFCFCFSFNIIDSKTSVVSAVKIEKADIYKRDLGLDSGELNCSFIFKGKDNYKASLEKQPSSLHGKILNSGLENRIKAMLFVYSLTNSEKDAVTYAFPEIAKKVDEIYIKELISPVNATLSSYENTGKIFIENSKNGLELDKNTLFCNIFYNLRNKNTNLNKNNFVFELKYKEILSQINKEYLTDCLNLKGSFKTNFSSSSQERKNNIITALKALDGKVVYPGEEFSFNGTTGIRNEEKGYQKAKIIKAGTFVYDIGGGVCQVSSTLYNSVLLADLSVTEVHPHSLPVSYVMPCFDAMVSSGSSDLKFVNNTKKPIIIACSSAGDECLVNIYGVKNEFSIVRKSEKTETIEDFETEISKDYKAFGFDKPLEKGEERIVCSGKAGYKAQGELEYYKNGVLIKTKKIRENTYKPTKQVILVGE